MKWTRTGLEQPDSYEHSNHQALEEGGAICAGVDDTCLRRGNAVRIHDAVGIVLRRLLEVADNGEDAQAQADEQVDGEQG